MAEVEFLFGNKLISALEELIKESKHKLLLISPFIDLDKRIQDALREKLTKHDFEILVLFGKNEDNIYRSIKNDSLEFFKKFPNIEIRHEERLHAKFYLNDFKFIMTSLNLYDYSLAKNIEVGITCDYGTKGFIGKVLDGTTAIIDQGVDKVKKDVLGMNMELNPIEEFKKIFLSATLKYKTEPNIVDAGGLRGMVGGKKLDGFKVIIDDLASVSYETKSDQQNQTPVASKDIFTSNYESLSPSNKTQSASQISKLLGIPQSEIINFMQMKGLIIGDKISNAGLEKGLVMKTYMGKDYIAYPENLEELSSLKSK